MPIDVQLKPKVGRRTRAGVAVVVVLLAGLASAGPALADSAWWGLTSGSWPTNLQPEGVGKVIVTAQNRGYEDASGVAAPIVVNDTLPAGLEIVKNTKGIPEIESVAGEAAGNGDNRGPVTCSAPSSRQVECTFGGTFERLNDNDETEIVPKIVPPAEQLEVRIAVRVAADASSSEENTVSVSGGDIAGDTLARPISVGEATPFGVEDYQLLAEEEGGRPSTQAGIHPFQLTTVIALNTDAVAPSLDNEEPAALTKDLTFQLPPGLIGNPTPFAECTDAQFDSFNEEKTHNLCPAKAAIGVVAATFSGHGFDTTTAPLYNLTPLAGEPARFGFEVANTRTILNTSVRTGGDYGVTVHVSNITEAVGVLVSKVTFWGVPGDPRHNSERGAECLDRPPSSSCSPASESEPPPFLSLPTACTGPMLTTVQADSWTEPNPARPLEAPLSREYEMGALDGCNHLQFRPEVSVAPDVPDGSTPTGLEVRVHVPQTAALDSEGLAESALKELTLELPEGVAVNAASADGLEACSEQQIGYLPELSAPAAPRFTPEEPSCPNASKIGELEIETPLLSHALKGFVYLASPAPFGEPGPLGETGLNPFASLVSLYIVAKDPVSGTLIKLPVKVTLNPATGRMSAISSGVPDLPFETLRLHMFGEDRAPLGTPGLCGPYTTTASFAPWSGNEASQADATFDITSGPNGSTCQAPLPFTPSLASGTTNIQAGAFSPLTTTISREDGNQNIASVQLRYPPGLSGILTGVKLCPEAQANAGTCGPESLVGHTIVSVGLGSDPYTVTGGEVFLTEGFEGAPFGLSIVNHANAGPFHLGNVVVRAKVEVDPHTAALTVTTGAIPHIIDGIPLEIKHVNVTIERAGFTFNPTNCQAQSITGSISSVEGASTAVSVPFQVTNCATLSFAPKFMASTSARTSKLAGSSLTTKVVYPNAPQGTQADIAAVKVDLPRQLPSQLKTLQKACVAAVFEANPAGCPPESIVGHAKVVTPLVPVPLAGPAYFVSHGDEAFPSLVIVLQGYGVTVELVGSTFIDHKTGVTSTTFKTVPDTPFDTFELVLPQGQYSALGADLPNKARDSFCGQNLKMPVLFIAQNGLELHQVTHIAVTGCRSSKKPKKRKAKRRDDARKK
jgi:hypothetical protein